MIFLCTESYIPLSKPKPTNSKAFSGFNNLNILAKNTYFIYLINFMPKFDVQVLKVSKFHSNQSILSC